MVRYNAFKNIDGSLIILTLIKIVCRTGNSIPNTTTFRELFINLFIIFKLLFWNMSQKILAWEIRVCSCFGTFLQSLNLYLPQQIFQIDVYFPGCTESQFGKSAEEDADSNFVKKVPRTDSSFEKLEKLWLKKTYPNLLTITFLLEKI